MMKQRDREKRNSEQLLSHKSENPMKQSLNTTYSSDTARKRKSRENADLRENENTCDTLYKLEDLKVLRRSPDLLNNVKIGQG